MEKIAQQEPMGCGIACVASVTKKPYNIAKGLFEKPENAALKGYYCNDLIRALSKKGLNYEYSKVNSRNKALANEEGSIVFIKRSKKYPEGHFLLKTSEGWMNPWINFPKITPAKAGFQKKLPGVAQWIIYKKLK